MTYGFKLMIEAERACFTRPELKVERCSYDVPTPGALEGLLKSVYWKPAIRYVIDRIIVFNPIRFVNVRRNEVKYKVSVDSMKSRMNHGTRDPVIYTDQCRNQRASMILTNVRYGVEFHFELTGLRSEKEDEGAEKHTCIIRRRLEQGQYFRTPCMGCAEFPVRRMQLTEDFSMDEISTEIRAMGDVDLGYMLYRMQFRDGGKPINGDWSAPKYSDCADALYYRPHMIGGVIDVAAYRRDLRC